MDKIIIVNWLLTRRCNLSCSYCGIVRDQKFKYYPNMKYFEENEMTTVFVLETLKRLQKHNPYMFHIFYGGEPLLREDLPEIINFCNNKNIYYTIITNNSEEVQPALKKLFKEVDYVDGLTSSVDPIIFQKNKVNTDRTRKSKEGLERLIELNKYKKVKDLVAEITIDNNNLEYIEPLVKILDENNITSSITFIDIAKNQYYDFSNVNDESLLVQPSKELKRCLYSLIDKGYDIHMSKPLLEDIINILPAKMDCRLEDSFHNLTIDTDGSIRLCLRIRGIAPSNSTKNILNFITPSGVFNFKKVKDVLRVDKIFACKGCNWTCQLMSKRTIGDETKLIDLLHFDKRS